jgi:hypothetical protein
MTRLAFLSFILAVTVTPVQAQTNQAQPKQPPAPLGFNGHVFDPPMPQYDTPPMVRGRPSASEAYRSYAAPPPGGYDGPYYGDARAQRYR